MARNNPHDLTSLPYHQVNHTRCLMCPARFCMSCYIGCPECGFGKGWDRREAVRVPAQDVHVEIRDARGDARRES